MRDTLLLADGRPSPVERVDLGAIGAGLELLVKRDDRVSSVYGGNKVRKLEYLLGRARAAGRSRILTVGAAGSHHVLATALFGSRHGFDVEAVLFPQPGSEHARTNLRVALAHGLRPILAPSAALASRVVAALASRDVSFVPVGGSNVTGSLGFVDAARELAAQVAAGALPEPHEIVVALGSGGTAAGLAAGLEREGLRTRVVGVAVARPAPALAAVARRLAWSVARATGLSRRASARAARRLSVDAEWTGRGYAYPTPEGRGAMDVAASLGLALDATYTAKAFAAALARVRERGRGSPLLFWHTLSTVPLPSLPEGAFALPPALERLFLDARDQRPA